MTDPDDPEAYRGTVADSSGYAKALLNFRNSMGQVVGSTVRKATSGALQDVYQALRDEEDGGDGGTPPEDTDAVRDERSVLTYAAEQEQGKSSYTDAEAIQQAKDFSLISCQIRDADKGTPRYPAAQVAKMRKAAKDQGTSFRLIPYINGGFTSAGQTHPEAWYAHTANGDRIMNEGTQYASGKRYLMAHWNPDYRAYIAALAKKIYDGSDYDGIWIDVLGAPPTVSPVVEGGAVPDPTTGGTLANGTAYWSHKPAWYVQSNKTAAAIRDALPAGSMVIANGLKSGVQYKSFTKALMNGITGGMPESFTRVADETGHPALTNWLAELAMVQDASKAKKVLTTLSKTWPPSGQPNYVYSSPTAEERMRFAFGTMMLVNDGTHYQALRVDKVSPFSVPRWFTRVNYGYPLGAYKVVGATYQREFSKCMVVVNPSTSSWTGSVLGSSVTLPAHTAKMVMKA